MTAYGTEAVSYKNKQVIRKGGDIGTFHSTMWLLPKERLGIFITASADVKGIGEFITSFIDTHYPASKADKGQKAYVKTPAEELTQLTGTYRYIRYSETTYGKVINFFRPYVQLKVAAEDGGLLVELMGEHRQFRQITPLVFEERNRETVGNQNRLTFVADKRNNVLYLQMPEEATYFKKVEGYEDITIHKWLAIFFTAAFLILSILLFVQRKRGESSLLRRIALWNCLVHLVFIPVFVVIAMKVMAGASTALLYIPLTLPLLAVPLTALLITLAIKDWSNKGWRGGVRFVPVATCFVSFLFPLFLRYWNLLGY
ncbi:hypothetical protein [Aneurinibacillus tyrosinisolvens]|uniref:hypothetical protein n=1 Tax=Aneurinibacillus tyrosinisolvens TaxID=1443435 RepID=UPI00063FA9C2|nr:hypothetical protein [Aneurinibacillus tyrosinisolvens]